MEVYTEKEEKKAKQNNRRERVGEGQKTSSDERGKMKRKRDHTTISKGKRVSEKQKGRQEERHTPQLEQPHEEQSPAQSEQLVHEHGDMLSYGWRSLLG